jgi:hypothetical protein
LISLPFNSNPCISALAVSAADSSSKVTKPNPLDLPENLSDATKASVTSPNFEKASFKSSAPTSQARLPTNNFFAIIYFLLFYNITPHFATT